MSNRTARHQRPGDKNLRGKLSKRFCPCCDAVINHRGKVLRLIHEDEMLNAIVDERANGPFVQVSLDDL